MHMTEQKSIKPRWFTLLQSSCITFMPQLIYFAASMIMTVTALLIVASQSIASLHLYWAGTLLVLPNTWKPSYSRVSTINTYAWHFKPFQVNSHVLPINLQNASQFVLMFHSSWGSMWCLTFNLVIYSWRTFIWTSGTSAYPIILQKELAMGFPVPN